MSQDLLGDMSRRGMLIGIGAGAAVLALAPGAAHATRDEANDAISTLVGGAKPQMGKVSLKLPEIAENGNTVPFTVVVDNPMVDGNYVKAIHVMAEGNPAPGVVSYYLQPTGKAEVYGRMRLAKTQDVRAVAVLSDGSVWEGKKEVKVTIGGCGG